MLVIAKNFPIFFANSNANCKFAKKYRKARKRTTAFTVQGKIGKVAANYLRISYTWLPKMCQF